MRTITMVVAVSAAVLAFPLAAKAQDGTGPTNWANAGGTDPARDLVGLGTRVFNRGRIYSAGAPAVYSWQALYQARTPARTSGKPN
jgi:hypothetical protein